MLLVLLLVWLGSVSAVSAQSSVDQDNPSLDQYVVGVPDAEGPRALEGPADGRPSGGSEASRSLPGAPESQVPARLAGEEDLGEQQSSASARRGGADAQTNRTPQNPALQTNPTLQTIRALQTRHDKEPGQPSFVSALAGTVGDGGGTPMTLIVAILGAIGLAGAAARLRRRV